MIDNLENKLPQVNEESSSEDYSYPDNSDPPYSPCHSCGGSGLPLGLDGPVCQYCGGTGDENHRC